MQVAEVISGWKVRRLLLGIANSKSAPLKITRDCGTQQIVEKRYTLAEKKYPLLLRKGVIEERKMKKTPSMSQLDQFLVENKT